MLAKSKLFLQGTLKMLYNWYFYRVTFFTLLWILVIQNLSFNLLFFFFLFFYFLFIFFLILCASNFFHLLVSLHFIYCFFIFIFLISQNFLHNLFFIFLCFFLHIINLMFWFIFFDNLSYHYLFHWCFFWLFWIFACLFGYYTFHTIIFITSVAMHKSLRMNISLVTVITVNTQPLVRVLLKICLFMTLAAMTYHFWFSQLSFDIKIVILN